MLAAVAASELGRPFTRHVTVHWTRVGVPDAQAAAATGKLVKLMSDWGRWHGERVLWAWVRENDAGKGSHLHMLVACPAHLPIGRMWRRWLRKITGRPYRARAIKTAIIGGRLGASTADPVGHRRDLFNVVAYLCKGIRPDHAAGLGIMRAAPGGQIIGKRAAVCQSLSARH